MAALLPTQPALKVAIVGDGSLRQELTSQITRLGLDKTCRLLGHRDDIEFAGEIRLEEFSRRGPIDRFKESACYAFWRVL